MAEGLKKEVISINEMDSLNRLLNALNEFDVSWDESERVVITSIVVGVTDRSGGHMGTITKWSKAEDVKWEPEFKVDF